jgi:hypothetical protein
MPYFEITETQLKTVSRFSYNAKGFILIEWGDRKQHHFRLDLAKWDNGRYTRFAGNSDAYEYAVQSIHLKLYDGTNQARTADFWYYFYVVYVNAGVWQPVWDYVKREARGSMSTSRLDSGPDDQAYGYRMISSLLEDLSEATGTQQGIACGPLADPRSLPGFVPRV